MSGFCDQAMERLKKEAGTVTGSKESAMKDAVRQTLDYFRKDLEEEHV